MPPIQAMTRRRALLAGIAAGFAAPAFAANADLSLDQIIARHTKARGGRAALDAIGAEYVDQDITENGSTVNAHYLCDKQPAFRIDIYDKGKHTFCEGLDAKGPWIWRQADAAARDGVADGAKSAIQGIQFNLYGLHAFPGLGNRLSLEGRQTIAGTSYYVIGVNMRGSYQTYLYLDPQSFLVMRRRDDRCASGYQCRQEISGNPIFRLSPGFRGDGGLLPASGGFGQRRGDSGNFLPQYRV